MAKYLDENGLATQISIEKATFISKSDVQEVEVDSSPTANSTNLVTSGGVYNAIPSVSGKEDTANKVTSLSSSSTDTEYPSALCVYNIVGDIETLINAL